LTLFEVVQVKEQDSQKVRPQQDVSEKGPPRDVHDSASFRLSAIEPFLAYTNLGIVPHAIAARIDTLGPRRSVQDDQLHAREI
jgi:hypothetical protein